MAMRVTSLEVSEWGTAKVRLSVAHREGREKNVVLFSKFCRRDEAVEQIQGFLDANPTINSNHVSAVFEPTADVAYLGRR